MKTDDIVKHLKLQDRNIEFYKKEINRLEKQVEVLKDISNVHNNIDVYLKKDEYTRDEISLAYNRMMEYEGIRDDRAGGLITDTFIEFLNGTHHSLNNE